MRRPRLAFLYAVPIAILGGLIGLGGAEFRLPVLAGAFQLNARSAVAFNLAVSLATVSTALVARGLGADWSAIDELKGPLLSMAAGATISAFFGPSLAYRLSNDALERTILALLLAIGIALIAESILGFSTHALTSGGVEIAIAFILGIGIGLVGSLLGVAGGEMIIPSLIFVFGAPVKVAGTASLAVSLPSVAVGVVRYLRKGAYADSIAVKEIVVPMALGSVIGAVMGALFVGIIPSSVLKFGLGVMLIVSALRVFFRPHPT